MTQSEVILNCGLHGWRVLFFIVIKSSKENSQEQSWWLNDSIKHQILSAPSLTICLSPSHEMAILPPSIMTVLDLRKRGRTLKDKYHLVWSLLKDNQQCQLIYLITQVYVSWLSLPRRKTWKMIFWWQHLWILA